MFYYFDVVVSGVVFFLFMIIHCYRNVKYFCILILYYSTVLNSLMSSSGILDFLCIISWHLQTVTVVFLPLQFGGLLSLFRAWVLWLGLPVLMLSTSGEWHPCRVLSLRSLHCWVRCYCGLITYGLYYVGVCSLYTHFLENFLNHKWMLNFVRSFFHICWGGSCGFYSSVC